MCQPRESANASVRAPMGSVSKPVARGSRFSAAKVVRVLRAGKQAGRVPIRSLTGALLGERPRYIFEPPCNDTIRIMPNGVDCLHCPFPPLAAIPRRIHRISSDLRS